MGDDEAAIRAVLAARERAIHERDAAALARLCTADVLDFDLAPPLAAVGAATVAERARAWFATKRGPIEETLHQARIAVDGRVAFVTGFTRLVATERDGAPVDLWMRTTLGLVRGAEGWRFAHLHGSVPFHMDGSLRAAVELAP